MVALAAVAALDVRIDTIRVRAALVAGIAMLFFVRMGVIAANWVQAQRVYQPILAAMEQLPKGARVAVLVGGDNFPYLANPPLDHVPNMAVITRDAYLNTLFAEPGKQILQVVYGSEAPFPSTLPRPSAWTRTRLAPSTRFPTCRWTASTTCC
jgi:hypothetical protein